MIAGELPARAGVARDGGVRGGLGRVEQGVVLRVAPRGVARRALHPRHVAAGVHEEDLRHGRRAQAHGDHVLQGVHGAAQVGRDAHVGIVFSRAHHAMGRSAHHVVRAGAASAESLGEGRLVGVS